jgi:hypothetical protein
VTISLTPDLERALADAAHRRGTTPELLAQEYIRERLLPAEEAASGSESGTLADFLDGYIGVFDSSELVPGGAQLSEDTGRQFTDLLLRRREQGRL